MTIPLPLMQSHSLEPPILSTRSKFGSWCSWITKVQSAWYAVHLSHRGGKYSIERLLALEEYTRQTSLLRVLLVCVGTPLPMIILVILQEYIPLQDPKAGWRANYGFWLRVGILGGFVAIGMVAQAERLIERVAFSWRQYVQIFFFQAILYPAASMVVAHLWAFPIPFMGISLNVVFVLLFVGGFRGIAGKSVVRKMLANAERLVRHVSFVSTQLALSIVYPVYQVAFSLALNSPFEIPVILLLPLLKLLMKNILLRTSIITHVEDMMPEGVIFTVDFFNALYLVSSMQSASSIVTVVAIMLMDFAQTLVQLRGLHQRTSTIRRRLHQAVGDTKDVLSSAVLLCSTKFEQQTHSSIRIRSCLPHQLSQPSRRLLDVLEGRPRSPGIRDLPQKKLRATKSLDWNFVRRVTAAVHPDRMAPLVLEVKHWNDDAIRAAAMASFARSSPAVHAEILHETLEMFFTSECIVLTEYLESVIPLVYASFVVILVHLPSALYHTELDGVTTENVGSAVASIFVYALLELESFVVLAGMLRRNCGMRALYHLAFVLETQTMLIQTKVVVWVLMTLAFRVVHFEVAKATFQTSSFKLTKKKQGIPMDELQSVGVGIALGLVLVSFLAYHPGEPFDYTTDCGDKCGTEHAPPAEAKMPSKSPNTEQMQPRISQQQVADIERAAQCVKIQKLQELLGLEKEKAQQLVDRAKEEATNAATHGRSSSSSYSTSSSTWLDCGFFVVMFGLLVWVLWQDYSINLFSVAAHLFPREAAVFQQVVAAPQGLLSTLSTLWG